MDTIHFLNTNYKTRFVKLEKLGSMLCWHSKAYHYRFVCFILAQWTLLLHMRCCSSLRFSQGVVLSQFKYAKRLNPDQPRQSAGTREYSAPISEIDLE